jgi:hypothetical protein
MSKQVTRLLNAVSNHVKFFKLDSAGGGDAIASKWRNTIMTSLKREESDSVKESRLLRSEKKLKNNDLGSERLIDEYSFLIESLSEKRRLQILDAGAETILSTEQLTRLAARRVGMDVPDHFGDVSSEANRAAAATLNKKLQEKLQEAEYLGEDNSEEGRLREKRIQAIAQTAKDALAAELSRRHKPSE